MKPITSDSTGHNSWNLAKIWPIVAFALIYAVLYHYPIVESDLFWQIRAGEEIQRTHVIQTIETWSSTAQGAVWYNFQWLSCLIEYWVSKLGPAGLYSYLPMLRAFLVFSLALILGGTLKSLITSDSQRIEFTNSQHRAALIFGLTLFQFLIAPRLLMRPELFVFGLDIFLLNLWFFQTHWRLRVFGTLGVLILWANLHAGLLPLGLFQALALVWADPTEKERNTPWKHRALLSISILCTALLNPIGYRGLMAPWTVMTNYPKELLNNPDQAALSLRWYGSLSNYVALLFLIMAVLGMIALSKTALKLFWTQKGIFRTACVWIKPALGLVLIGATLSKARVLPFAAFYMIYPVSELINVLIKKLSTRIKPAFLELLTISLALLSICSQVSAAYFQGLTPGYGLLPGKYPEQSARFIAENHLPHELFNDFDFGGYLTDRLRSYRVSMDGRELPFIPFLSELRQVSQAGSLEKFDAFLSQHSFKTLLLEPRPYQPDFQDPLAALAPLERWALVFFDDSSLVYIKRDAEWQSFIESHELRLLQHGRPPELIASGILKNPDVKPALEKELDHCLTWKPTPLYCLRVQEIRLELKKELSTR